MCDEEYNDYLEEQNEDYFDNHADEMYEEYVNQYYQDLEDNNKFELIEHKDDYYKYQVPNTNIFKERFINDKQEEIVTYYKYYSRKDD